jgi:hypothetical protein
MELDWSLLVVAMLSMSVLAVAMRFVSILMVTWCFFFDVRSCVFIACHSRVKVYYYSR